MKQTVHGELVSMGVDWITCVGSTEPQLPNMLSMASELLRIRLWEGFERRGWGMAGFTGFQSRGIQFGIRNKEAIVRLSGDLAATNWRKLYEVSDSVTRVDFQCTTTTGESPERRIARAYAAARRHCRGKKKAPAVTRINCTTGGSTVYLGKRQSMIYGRIYDKHAESKDPRYQNCVRHEIELKDRMARSELAHVVRCKHEPDAIAGKLLAFFRNRGVTLELGYECGSFTKAPVLAATHQRSLQWLAVQCRPTVQRLAAAGYLSEVAEALGLSAFVSDVGPTRKTTAA
jgi:hypothetical protein